MKHCCANCAYLSKERIFNGQQTWLVCDRDVNGEATLETIKEAILTHDANEEHDCIGWEDKDAPEETLFDILLKINE